MLYINILCMSSKSVITFSNWLANCYVLGLAPPLFACALVYLWHDILYMRREVVVVVVLMVVAYNFPFQPSFTHLPPENDVATRRAARAIRNRCFFVCVFPFKSHVLSENHLSRGGPNN